MSNQATFDESHDVDPTNTIDLTPTVQEYINMAAFFGRQVESDFKVARRNDAMAIMRTIVEIGVFIGSQPNALTLKAELLKALGEK